MTLTVESAPAGRNPPRIADRVTVLDETEITDGNHIEFPAEGDAFHALDQIIGGYAVATFE